MKVRQFCITCGVHVYGDSETPDIWIGVGHEGHETRDTVITEANPPTLVSIDGSTWIIEIDNLGVITTTKVV